MTALRVGIAGLGTVGGGLFKLLQQQAKIIEARCGVSIVVTAVSARNRTQQRGFDVANLVWHENAVLLARDKNVDVVCELIGGSDGISLELCVSALEAGKHVVTANKALMAIHGSTLAQKAESNNVIKMIIYSGDI